jgi:hypothetical protein
MPFDQDRYTIRRKVLQIFGASFHVYGPAGELLGFSRQKAFKLREDIRVYADETQQRELLAIRSRQVIDWSAAYDVVDSAEGRKAGAARRKGWSSVVRDSWELLDADDRPLAKLQEDSTTLALLRRFLSNLIPQTYHLRGLDGQDLAELRVRFNPFVYKLDVAVRPGAPIDRRLVLAVGVLLAAIEGRQQ